ncbi:hypothetical protein ACHAWF_006626 [Thalassiosira exigua]
MKRRSRSAALADDAATLAIMLEQEVTAYACRDYLSCHDGFDCSRITPRNRAAIVDWCHAIVDRIQCERANVAVAMNILDRFVGAPGSEEFLRDRLKYQLAAVTSLYISLKLNEQVTLGSDGFAVLSEGAYDVDDIEETERLILRRLSWRVNPPTSDQVGRRILQLLSPPGATRELMSEILVEQAEESVRDIRLSSQRPSTIAMAAILNALEHVSDKACDRMLKRLEPLLKEFDFDLLKVIIQAKGPLRLLQKEELK